jgi:hypothetical protein
MNPDADVITLAARQLTRGEPSAELRGRVLSRIERDGSSWRRWWFVPAAAIALIATTLVASRVTRPAIEPERPTRTSTAALERTGTSVPAVDAAPVAPAVVRARTRRPPAGVSPQMLAWRERAVPALPGVATLNVPQIQPIALDLAQLMVKPLPAPPAIQLDPIDGGPPR